MGRRWPARMPAAPCVPESRTPPVTHQVSLLAHLTHPGRAGGGLGHLLEADEGGPVDQAHPPVSALVCRRCVWTLCLDVFCRRVLWTLLLCTPAVQPQRCPGSDRVAGDWVEGLVSLTDPTHRGVCSSSLQPLPLCHPPSPTPRLSSLPRAAATSSAWRPPSSSTRSSCERPLESSPRSSSPSKRPAAAGAGAGCGGGGGSWRCRH